MHMNITIHYDEPVNKVTSDNVSIKIDYDTLRNTPQEILIEQYIKPALTVLISSMPEALICEELS